jgi:hypothetical protein
VSGIKKYRATLIKANYSAQKALFAGLGVFGVVGFFHVG